MESRWQKLKSRVIEALEFLKRKILPLFGNINVILFCILLTIIAGLSFQIVTLNNKIDESSNETINLINDSLKEQNKYIKRIEEIDNNYKKDIEGIKREYQASLKELEKIKETKQKQIIKASYKQPDKVAKEIADEFDFDLVNSKSLEKEKKK
jgi:predicted PurR-regulated permease PerM